MKTQNYILFIFFILIASIKSFGYQNKSGTISTQDIWSDTIHVTGDITIIQGGDVIINPGTYIEFEGFYFIKINQTGKITAIGNVNDTIRFIPFNLQTGWKGIIFETLTASADSSVFEYCSFQYSKGALSVKNFDKVRVNHCNFSNNQPGTSSVGGGIYCYYSNIMINNCIFKNNYAGDGGALYFMASHATINNSRITFNTIYWCGGGVYCDTSYLYFNNCLIDSNYHTNSGGGAGIYSKKSDVTLNGCRVMNNSRNAIYSYNYGGQLKLYNTIVANNEGADGGGIMCLGTDLTIINSTIVNNKAGAGQKTGGIYCYYCHSFKIENSIIWNNSGIYPDFYYVNYSPQIINCNIRDGNLFNLPDSQYVNNISVDPKFVNPSAVIGKSNDALQADWSLTSCSPCINKGDSSLSGSLFFVDFNNNPRISNDTIDIGACEFQGIHTISAGVGILYVKENGIGDGSSWTNALGDIQTAVNTPLGCYDYLEVWVAAGTYFPLFTGQVYIRETSFKLRDNVRVYGGFIGNETDLNMRNWKLNPTILSGDVGITNDSTDNVYNVVRAVNIGNTAILDGFVVTGGYADYNSVNKGGGVFCSYSIPSLNNLIIKNNKAGGGVYLEYSQPLISNFTVYNNLPGGIFMSYSNPKIINSQFINNKNTSYSDGGGMTLQNSNPKILNSVFANNYGYQGGAINCMGSSPIIINSLFVNNAASDGAGIYINSGSHPLIYNSVFWNNKDAVGVNNFASYYHSYDSLFTVFSSLVQGGNVNNFTAAHYQNNIDAVPRFIKPTINIGLDNNVINADWNLFPCSPCINAGNNSLFSDTITYDMSFNSRIFNDTIDIGPYEFQGNESGMHPKNIIYVKQNANGNGSSWTDAIGNLQQAIDMPLGCYDSSEVWVAAGNYYPNSVGLTNVNEASFNLRNNIVLYGGFNGSETLINQRDWNVNKSILNGNVGSLTDSTDNSSVVVSVLMQDSIAILDGFTIENGYYNGFGNSGGSGIYCNKSRFKLKNLTIVNNFCNSNGGGLYAIDSKIDLENSLFTSNKANSGGAMSLNNTVMNIKSCKIINNSGNSGSGGISLQTTKGTIYNCLISNNYSSYTAAIASYQSNYAVVNSTLVNNKSGYGNPGAINMNDTLLILNSILWEPGNSSSIKEINCTNVNLLTIKNSDIKNGSLINVPAANYLNNIDADPLFKKPNNIIGNSNQALLGNWSLKSCSPCINAGMYDTTYTNSLTDICGNPRIYNNGIVDMGAYEYQDTSKCLFIKFVVIEGDSAGVGYNVSLDGWNYNTTDSLGETLFDNNSLGDKYKYYINHNYSQLFSDSITNLQHDTIIYFYSSGIKKNNIDSEWLIYPNPVKDKITITATPGKMEVDIINPEGQQLITCILYDNNKTIDVSTLSRGLFFIRIKKEDKTQMKKFIKL